MLEQIVFLAIMYQIKHFAADFLLQGEYMLGKFKTGIAYIPPLAAHCGVHALGTLMICVSFLSGYHHAASTMETMLACWHVAVVLSAIDFIAHGIMDRIKAAPHYMGRWKAATPESYAAAATLLASKQKNDEDDSGERLEAIKHLNSNKYFWRSIGGDQFVHHMTHYYIIYRLVTFV